MGMFVVFALAGIAWQVDVQLIQPPPTDSKGIFNTRIDYLMLRIDDVGLGAATLSAILLSLGTLTVWICKLILRDRRILVGVGLVAVVMMVGLTVYSLTASESKDEALTIAGPSAVDRGGYTWTATVVGAEPLFSKVQFIWFLDFNEDGRVQDVEQISHSSIIAGGAGQAVDEFRWDFDENSRPYGTHRLAVVAYILNPETGEQNYLRTWMPVKILDK